MSYTRPTLSELIDRVKADVASRTEGRAFLKRSVEGVWSPVVAALAHGVYGAIDWTYAQLLPVDSELATVVRWGEMIEEPRLGGSRAGGGTISLTGQPGATVVEGTLYRASSNDALLVTQLEVVLDEGGAGIAPVVAVEAGAAGNVAADEQVTIVTPLRGVDAVALVVNALTGGSDVELLERYRARVLSNLRLPPRAGGPGDYRRWALEVPGVTRAWEFPARYGLGTVALGFVMDDRSDIIPTPEDVAAVQAYIDARKPLDVRAVYVRAPIPKIVDLTIDVLPKNMTVVYAVIEELKGLFSELGIEDALVLSVLDEAISAAPPETQHVITSHTSLTPGPWEILVRGTWIFPDLLMP
jgi:uncharacterized phage protein gp47/JayE